jgi:hypothetical protein
MQNKFTRNWILGGVRIPKYVSGPDYGKNPKGVKTGFEIFCHRDFSVRDSVVLSFDGVAVQTLRRQ